MRAWTSAELLLVCSSDRTHAIAKGERHGVATNGVWRKVFCRDCFKRIFGEVEDTGELVEVTDHPGFQRIGQLAGAVLDLPPDHAKAAANDQDE